MIRTVEEYLQSRIQKSKAGCWLWVGKSIDQDGYANAFWPTEDREQSRWRAHRLTYEVYVGPIPEGLVLDHLCEVRNCVNPDHMNPTTPRANTLRSTKAPAAINARKTHCKRGHEFTEENTYIAKRGNREERHCRECGRLHHEAQRQGLRL